MIVDCRGVLDVDMADPELKLWTSDGNRLFVATHSDEGQTEVIVGCVSFYKVSNTTARLRRFGVSSNCRNLGIGSLLIKKVIETARNGGHDILTVETNDQRASAVHTYQKNGYRW